MAILERLPGIKKVEVVEAEISKYQVLTPEVFLGLSGIVQEALCEVWGITGWASALVETINTVKSNCYCA